MLQHIYEVKQWRDFYDKDQKSAKQHEKEYYLLDTDRPELEEKYRGAIMRKNVAEKVRKTQYRKDLPAYEKIIKAIHNFIKNKLDPIITTSPSLAQHNP
jgi:hypothetical protein